jgi:DNA-binding IclR family transcriptional regulator
MTTHGKPRTVQAVEIALDIIEVLQEKSEAGVTEIASELDRSKGTVHSQLATLVDNEYVVRDGETYRLSLKFIDLSQSVKDELVGYEIVKEELEDLAEQSGELAQFATEEHGRAVYLYKVGSEKAVQTASSAGDREYLHCLSLGKAMLAHMPEERVDEIIEEYGLPEYTDQTITTRDELMTELAEIRERGYAFDEEEKIEGIRCVAAPVLENGDIFGAISVSGPSTRMRDEFYREELPDLVTRSANVIEINTKFA